jgi:hypothetical protein
VYNIAEPIATLLVAKELNLTFLGGNMSQKSMFLILIAMGVIYFPLWLGTLKVYEIVSHHKPSHNQITMIGISCIAVLVLGGSFVALSVGG